MYGLMAATAATGYPAKMTFSFARQQVIGVIFVFRSYSGRFSSNDRALLQSFGNQPAIAVKAGTYMGAPRLISLSRAIFASSLPG